MEDWKLDPFWFALGMVGQAVFFSRFLVQWVASERAGRFFALVHRSQFPTDLHK